MVCTGCWHSVLVALEVDDTVPALSAAAALPGGTVSFVVTSTRLLQRSQKALSGLSVVYLRESVPDAETRTGSNRVMFLTGMVSVLPLQRYVREKVLLVGCWLMNAFRAGAVGLLVANQPKPQIRFLMVMNR